MKKIALSLIFPLLLATCAAAQPNLSTPASQPYTIEYDKFDDRTRVKLKHFELAPTNVVPTRNMSFTISGFYKGQDIKAPIDSFLMVFSCSNDGWQFLRLHDLIFLADGVRLPIAKGTHDGKVGSGSRSVYVIEVMIYDLSRKDLERIAKSKTAEFQLGRFEGSFTPAQLADLRTFLQVTAPMFGGITK